MAQLENPEWEPEAPLLLTREQVAKLLNVSLRTVSYLLARRELARRKVGTKTLIPRSSVENFVKRDHATKDKLDQEQ